jgi:hypothetical protein
MRLLRVRFTVRLLTVAVAVAGVPAVAYSALRWYSARLMLRAEAFDNAEMRRLHRDHEVRLRAAIGRLRRSRPGTPDERESTDRVFELLRLSRVASNSREVESSERAPHSPERVSVALKWAEVAADEAAYEAALRERWANDFARGRMPHHISDDEVPPFRMPDGWTEDDLKYRQARRDE